MFSVFMRSGDYEFPAPVDYGVDYEDLDSEATKRNQLGRTNRDRIRCETKIIHVKWRIKSAELRSLASHLRPVGFSLYFLDLTIGDYTTGDMYCTKKSAKLLRNADDPAEQYVEYSANIIEL